MGNLSTGEMIGYTLALIGIVIAIITYLLPREIFISWVKGIFKNIGIGIKYIWNQIVIILNYKIKVWEIIIFLLSIYGAFYISKHPLSTIVPLRITTKITILIAVFVIVFLLDVTIRKKYAKTKTLPLPVDVPEDIKKDFKEAEKCYYRDCLIASATLFRSVFEKTLEAHGYKIDDINNLHVQIEAATKDGIISETGQQKTYKEIILHEERKEVLKEEIILSRDYCQKFLKDFYDNNKKITKQDNLVLGIYSHKDTLDLFFNLKEISEMTKIRDTERLSRILNRLTNNKKFLKTGMHITLRHSIDGSIRENYTLTSEGRKYVLENLF